MVHVQREVAINSCDLSGLFATSIATQPRVPLRPFVSFLRRGADSGTSRSRSGGSFRAAKLDREYLPVLDNPNWKVGRFCFVSDRDHDRSREPASDAVW